MLRRWSLLTRFLDDGRVRLTNKAAEGALRCVALGRKSWLFRAIDRTSKFAFVVHAHLQQICFPLRLLPRL